MQTLLYVIAKEDREIFNTFTFAEAERDILVKFLEKFENYCIPKKNVTTESHKGVGSRMPKIGPVDSKKKKKKIGTLIPPAVQNFSACLTFLLSALKLIWV